MVNIENLTPIKTITPDKRGRVHLADLTDNVDRYKVYTDEFQRVILEPVVEIPASELWLYQNKAALSDVLTGAQQIEDGLVHKADEDYASYIDDN